MPQITSTVLTDRASTPVNTTFVPVDIAQPGSVGVLASDNGILENAMRFTVQSRRTTNKKVKSKLTLTVPIIGTNASGQPVVLRVGYATVEMTTDLSATDSERNNLVGMVASALLPAKVLVNDAFVKGHAIY